jgi:hypothetical protein
MILRVVMVRVYMTPGRNNSASDAPYHILRCPVHAHALETERSRLATASVHGVGAPRAPAVQDRSEEHHLVAVGYEIDLAPDTPARRPGTDRPSRRDPR